jgi:heme exporter protein A
MSAESAHSFAVQTRDLGRRFGRRWALAHVNLEIPHGETLLLAGANGSGKTTLLWLVAGLYRASTGSLLVEGFDPRKERLACRRRLSLLSHHSFLYDRLSPLETLRIWARLLGRRAEDEELVALLREVELEEHRDQRVAGFSAGMRKRLALLRIKLEDPGLVLLDEPFAALDAAGQRLVEGWIETFRAQGTTVIMASHALERASRLCRTALFLHQGQISWQGPASEAPKMVEAVADNLVTRPVGSHRLTLP